jgi:hypothetical protein
MVVVEATNLLAFCLTTVPPRDLTVAITALSP